MYGNNPASGHWTITGMWDPSWAKDAPIDGSPQGLLAFTSNGVQQLGTIDWITAMSMSAPGTARRTAPVDGHHSTPAVSVQVNNTAATSTSNYASKNKLHQQYSRGPVDSKRRAA